MTVDIHLPLIAGISGMFFMLTQWKRTGITHPALQQETTAPHNETARHFRTRLLDESSRFEG